MLSSQPSRREHGPARSSSIVFHSNKSGAITEDLAIIHCSRGLRPHAVAMGSSISFPNTEDSLSSTVRSLSFASIPNLPTCHRRPELRDRSTDVSPQLLEHRHPSYLSDGSSWSIAVYRLCLRLAIVVAKTRFIDAPCGQRVSVDPAAESRFAGRDKTDADRSIDRVERP